MVLKREKNKGKGKEDKIDNIVATDSGRVNLTCKDLDWVVDFGT